MNLNVPIKYQDLEKEKKRRKNSRKEDDSIDCVMINERLAMKSLCSLSSKEGYHVPLMPGVTTMEKKRTYEYKGIF